MYDADSSVSGCNQGESILIDFLIDENTHDLVVRDGDLALTCDLQTQVRQALKILLRTLLGEWFLDERIGIPYFTQILGQKPSKLALTSIFRNAIKQTEGVDSIARLDVNFDSSSRTVSIDFEIILKDGNRLSLSENPGVLNV